MKRGTNENDTWYGYETRRYERETSNGGVWNAENQMLEYVFVRSKQVLEKYFQRFALIAASHENGRLVSVESLAQVWKAFLLT